MFSAPFERRMKMFGGSDTGASAPSTCRPGHRDRQRQWEYQTQRASEPLLRLRLRRSLGERAQPCESLAQQARDLHLRAPDALGDLGLREVFDEAHAKDRALARGDLAENRDQSRVELDQFVALVDPAHR